MGVTYFISGHLDLTKEEFEEHYVPMFDAALVAGSEFVVGDARGADAMAQQYLHGKTSLVRVYHMFDRPRNNAGFETVGGLKSDEARDQAMTIASNADIAWFRIGREDSGTARNVKRRMGK